MASQNQPKVVRRKAQPTEKNLEQRVEELMGKKNSSFWSYFWTFMVAFVLGAIATTMFVSETAIGADILATGQGQSRAVLTDSLTRQNQRISDLEKENLILETRNELLDSLMNQTQNPQQNQNLRQQRQTYRVSQENSSLLARKIYENYPPVPPQWSDQDLVSSTRYERGISYALTGKGEVAVWVSAIDQAGEVVFVKPMGVTRPQRRAEVYDRHLQLEPYTQGDSLVGWVEKTYFRGQPQGSGKVYRTAL